VDDGRSTCAVNDNLAIPLRLMDGGRAWIWAEAFPCLREAHDQKMRGRARLAIRRRCVTARSASSPQLVLPGRA
jgi:hypothetical protein